MNDCSSIRLDQDGDWFIDVDRWPSPNADDRPEGVDISLIVVHGVSLPPGQFGSGDIHRLFSNTLDADAHPYFPSIADLRVSAHLLIDRGATVTQFVPLTARAWHAGLSSFDGREACNDFSIGIELEGVDEEPYERMQLEALADRVAVIMDCYPAITSSRVVGHSDIAPGRKTDPGPAFDWERFHALLAQAQRT